MVHSTTETATATATVAIRSSFGVFFVCVSRLSSVVEVNSHVHSGRLSEWHMASECSRSFVHADLIEKVGGWRLVGGVNLVLMPRWL